MQDSLHASSLTVSSCAVVAPDSLLRSCGASPLFAERPADNTYDALAAVHIGAGLALERVWHNTFLN